MNTENQKLAKKIARINAVKTLISSYGMKYEIKEMFKTAMKHNIQDEDLELFIAVVHLEALEELELEMEAKQESNN